MHLQILTFLFLSFVPAATDGPGDALVAAPQAQVRMAHRTGRFWHVASYRSRVSAPGEAAPARTERPKATHRQFRFR